MPSRKKPKTLERLSLETIGSIFKSSCDRSTCYLLSMAEMRELDQFYVGLEIDPQINRIVRQLQVAFLEEVPQKFHQFILRECLVALSDLFRGTSLLHHEAGLHVQTSDLESRRRRLMREELQLAFLKFFCHRTAIKEINLTSEFLMYRPLHWGVVARLCSLLWTMESLTTLRLGTWNCLQYGLLSRHNQSEGWLLKYLPNLTRIQVSSVGEKFFEAIGTFCPNLKELKVQSSSITDLATFWVSKCSQLESIELFDNFAVTPIGFAQLLRALANLRSLGRCDVIGEAFTLLYAEKSIFRRSIGVPCPELLSLEEIDCEAKISSEALSFIINHCKNLKSLRFKFLPTEEVHLLSVEPSGTLSMLNSLNLLSELNLTACDFYGHHLFQVLQQRGKFLQKLELNDVDEMNWNSIELIGNQVPNLQFLSLRCCHFQSLPNLDSVQVEMTNASGLATERRPFQALQGLDIVIFTPMHLVVVKGIVQFASSLKSFIFNLLSDDLEEDHVRHIMKWSSFTNIEEFEITAGSRLSIHMVDRFCPLEKNGDECRAKKNQFKCGSFFVNLSGQENKLSWLGALPDFLHKASAQSSPKLKASFDNMKKHNFRVKDGQCTDSMANEKCHHLMEPIANTKLDDCAQNILNEKGDRTLGDVLCQRAMFYVPGQHFHSFEKVGFYHSACAGNWTQTLDPKGQPLVLKEELCCKYENDKGWFFRCDGSEFKKTCN